MSDSEREPREPSPFIPDEADAPRDPKTGAIKIDESDLDVPITVNINGCPNSCARIQVADIGFKGQMIDDGDGPVEGFQVHLGGSLGLDSGFGRKLRQHKVLSTELGDYIDRVVRNFVKQREQGERFATWAVRADEADLR